MTETVNPEKQKRGKIEAYVDEIEAFLAKEPITDNERSVILTGLLYRLQIKGLDKY